MFQGLFHQNAAESQAVKQSRSARALAYETAFRRREAQRVRLLLGCDQETAHRLVFTRWLYETGQLSEDVALYRRAEPVR